MPSNEPRESTFPLDAEVAEGLFITPRVIDHSVFREYSEGLRVLIREASGRQVDLRADSNEARQLCENLTQTASRLKERLETTAKILPALDQRVRKAEQFLDQASEQAKLPERLTEKLATEVAAAGQQVEQALTSAEARLSAIEARCSELAERAASDLARLEAIGSQLAAAATAAEEQLRLVSGRADALEADLDARADRSAARFEEKTERLIARTDHAYSTLTDGIEQMVSQVHARLAAVREEVRPLVEEVERVPAQLQRHVDAAVEAIEARTRQSVERIGALEGLCDRAVRLLGFDPSQPTDEIASDSLMMLVMRGDELEQQARKTADELSALRAAADEVRSGVGLAVSESAASMKDVETRGAALLASFEKALGDGSAQSGLIMSELSRLEQAIEDLEAKRAGLVVDANQTGQDLEQMVRSAASQLSELRAHATAELSRLQVGIAAQKRSLESLTPAKPTRTRSKKAAANPDAPLRGEAA